MPTPPANSLSIPTPSNSSMVGQKATTPAPVLPPPTAVVATPAKGPNLNSVVDYLGSIGAPTDLNSRATLASKLGIVTDPSLYTGSADQNTKLLGFIKAGQGSQTSNSVSAGTSGTSNGALGSAITSAVAPGGSKSQPDKPDSGPGSGTTAPPAGQTKTGSGTVATSGFTDPTTGAFDPKSYSAAALKDAQDSLASVLEQSNNSFTQGKTDLEGQFSQWKEDWQTAKDFAVQMANEYGGTYATTVAEHYDKLLQDQTTSYQSSLADLNTNKKNADLSAQSQFSQDKQGIEANVANFGMNQQEFNLTQSQDLYKNFTTFANTYNFTPTDQTLAALDQVGVTPGMDMSKLTIDQYQTAKNLAPDFFGAAEKAGITPTQAMASYLGGTFKAQAAALAVKKEQDQADARTASLQLAVERLATTAQYDQSREQYYNTMGAKTTIAPFINSPIAKSTAQSINALAQIRAAAGAGNNAASALGAMDAYVTGATGGRPTEAQIRTLLEGTGYADRFIALRNKLVNGGTTGIVDPKVKQQLDDLTLDLAKQRVISYTTAVYKPAQAALNNSPYADQIGMVPDYQSNLVDYLNGNQDATTALNASLTNPADGGTGSSNTTIMTGPDGTYTVPIDQIQNFLDNGYSQ